MRSTPRCAPTATPACSMTSFDAYANYQQQRGSNTAWTWEHQAMTRARCVLGDADMRARFDAVRKAVITAPRDASSLRAEIVAMRERMAGAHPRHQRQVRHQVQRRRHDRCRIRDAVPGAVAVGHAPRIDGQRRQHCAAGACRRSWDCCPQAWGTAPPAPTVPCARCSTMPASTKHQPSSAAQAMQAERGAILLLWHTVFDAPHPLD